MTDNRPRLGLLSLAALGVVFGDIGTSPLYALRECFSSAHGIEADHQNVLGILSLMVWSLVVIVCVKYVVLVMRADHHGEGGILALLALTMRRRRLSPRTLAVMTSLGVFGAALLYGDGIITPCITVLGAVEGLHIATAAVDRWVLPITLVVLVFIFAVQRHGTHRVGRVFGPVMLLWFTTLAVLGVCEMFRSPAVFAALSPTYAIAFLFGHGYTAFLVLGSVFLVVTGAEALYADLGHFGRKPIRTAWFAVVFPALLLNYFGQGALLLQQPEAADNPFYRLAPAWGVVPLVVLSTAASVIASQALISGAFSLTVQAIQLGYLPRLEARHTSSAERGQIYVPMVNRILLLCWLGVTLGFQSSTALANAYGVAVSMTMLITTMLLFFAARQVWQWSLWRTVLVCGVFLCADTVFFAANAVKIAQGGWFPLLVAVVLFAVMATWKSGRRRLGERLATAALPLDSLLESLGRGGGTRVAGTAVYMAGNPQGTPIALLHNLKHNRVVHECVILLTFAATDEPYVEHEERLQMESLPLGFTRLVASFGFMETPRLDEVLRACERKGFPTLLQGATYFLSRETVITKGTTRWQRGRGALFALLSRNAQSATAFFGLPVDRVVELGMQVEI